MKSLIALFALTLCSVSLFAPTAFCQDDDGFVPLFNGTDLQGWNSARSKGEDDWGPFSVNADESAIHVYAGEEADSQQRSDCLVSEGQYSHFILKVEYKWLENRFAPRTDWDRDAGLLFHVHGDLTRVWPDCIEMQIGESPNDKPNGRGNTGRFHSGDLFVLRKDLRTATPLDKTRSYSADGERKYGRGVKTLLGVENPKGEWNQMEIRVNGHESATFILNGEVVLETFDFHFKNEEGEKVFLDRGHIGLQAEWAELLYRNIRIKDLADEQTDEAEEPATEPGSEAKEDPQAGSSAK